MKRAIFFFVTSLILVLSLSAQENIKEVTLKPEYITPDPVFQVDKEGNIKNIAKVEFFNLPPYKDTEIKKKPEMVDYKKSIIFSDTVTSVTKAEKAIVFGVMIDEKGDVHPLKEENITFSVSDSGEFTFTLKHIPVNIEKINIALLETKGYASYRVLIKKEKSKADKTYSGGATSVPFAPPPPMF